MFIIVTLCLSIMLNVLLIWFVRKVQTNYILFIRDNLEGLTDMHQEFNDHLEVVNNILAILQGLDIEEAEEE